MFTIKRGVCFAFEYTGSCQSFSLREEINENSNNNNTKKLTRIQPDSVIFTPLCDIAELIQIICLEEL